MGLAGDRDFGGSATLVGVGSLPVTYKSNPDNNHSFLIGVRYAFGAAPAPAPGGSGAVLGRAVPGLPLLYRVLRLG